MVSAQKLVVDETKIKKAIASKLPLTITTYTLPHEMEVYIVEVITVFLKLTGHEKLKDLICYCVQELAVNAKKANTKRVFFNEIGLDLTNSDDYQKGMQHFKETTLNNIAHYLQLQKEKGLYIKLILQVRENIIYIEIRNNVVITHTELNRIHDRLALSHQYKSLEEALSQVIDDSEGSGLGLIILILMLKKMDLKEDYFAILSDETETVARIMIPLDQIQVENISVLSEAIANNINSLPQFPENIMEIQRLIANAEVDITTIARQLSTDPALTAELLKIVNSAQYMMEKHVDNIFEAVKMIGLRGIRNHLFSYGIQETLGDNAPEKKQLWNHCYKTAYYAYILEKNFRRASYLSFGPADDAYLCGILHDMGKIVFSAVHPQLLEKIRKFCANRKIPISTFEDLSAGANHAGIGALIAEKWNFPDNLVKAIRYHHDPLAAPKDCRNLVEATYLANMLCGYENGNITFEQFEEGPLASFGISTKTQLDSLLECLAQGFKKESKHK